MKKNLTILAVILVFVLSTTLTAQTSVCGQFHRKNCIIETDKKNKSEDEDEFMYNSQSRSGLFAQGSTSKMKCVIYKGMDYKMTVCCESAGSEVNFKIFDAKTNEELYDSAKNEDSKQFEFQSASTRQLIIEISIPAGETEAVKGKAADASCVGLLIQHKVATKLGFSRY